VRRKLEGPNDDGTKDGNTTFTSSTSLVQPQDASLSLVLQPEVTLHLITSPFRCRSWLNINCYEGEVEAL